ncbi:MAG: PD40 domain-containing protein [Kiritimatiellae bacterium]|nr:PD40 domain-containing protein [Kiritimatiellia bacterium]
MKTICVFLFAVSVLGSALCAAGVSKAPAQTGRFFLSPRHSQVKMTGEWFPELQRGGGGGPQCHWMSAKAGGKITLTFEGTSVTLVTRTGARTTWVHATHTNSLARLGRFDVRLDGKPCGTVSLAGAEADARKRPSHSARAELPVAAGLNENTHVLELVNAGEGEVTLAGFLVDRPQRGSEPDFSRESATLAAEAKNLPPILFVEGAPIRTVAGPCLLGHSAYPDGDTWGTAVKVFHPSRPDEPPRTLFAEADSVILDLALSHDAKTIWFSMRRHKSPCWHIYRLNADGSGLTQLTDGVFHDTSPAPLPDGRIAFISTREPGTHLVCATGPSSRVHVMNADGSGVKMLSSNTLADYCLTVRSDGRLMYTRWEYVDWNIMSRQSLWTQYPDGRHLELFFGNLLDDPPNLLQAREVPDAPGEAVCTFAPHHGSPFGAIGVVSAKNGPEGQRGADVRWLTPEFPSIMDFNHLWSYCWPYPLGKGRYLCSYGGGGMRRYRISLIDENGGRATVYDPGKTSAYCATPLAPYPAPKTIAPFTPESVKRVKIPAAPPALPSDEEVSVGYLYVADVMRGYAEGVAREDVKAVRIMEQLPKVIEVSGRRAYDQSPLMSVGTYYAKRVWGYAPVEKDGSAYFEVPAMKEIYLQLVDGAGREIQRMTSALNVMPGERRSCVGCHEGRMTASGGFAGDAVRRVPTPLATPVGLRSGVIDYIRDIQPIWNAHCVRCHGGTAPAKGLSLEDGRTRFFCRSYDGLNERARSDFTSYLSYGGAPEADSAKPLIHSILLNYGFADVLQPRQTGSFASRLPDYLERKHCGSDVTPDERRRVYEWIDAMVPYYTTTECAHLQARGKRDRWGMPDSPDIAPWAVKYARIFARSCARCHDAMNPANVGIAGDRRWEWVDLTRPELSPALVAHLPKSAGGRGIPTRDMAAFSGRDDPLWLELLGLFREGAAHSAQTPEADEAGFVPRSRGRLEYATQLKKAAEAGR